MKVNDDIFPHSLKIRALRKMKQFCGFVFFFVIWFGLVFWIIVGHFDTLNA